jgi:5'-phosphate synthase pdxT subunit
MSKRVGVLSLQGDFAAHGAALERLAVQPVYVREAAQLDGLDGLVLPGGESTTMLKLMRYEDLFAPLVDFGRRKPMFGTCAGAILMAGHVSGPEQESMGLVDLDVERNGYGRQIDSRVVEIDPEPDFARRGGEGKLEAVFIRAPIRHLVATFHPELTADPRVHRLFLEKL